MDPRFQMMRGQGASHPLLEFPTDDELRGGTSGEGMMPEVAHNLVDPSLYMVRPGSAFHTQQILLSFLSACAEGSKAC